LKKVRKARAIAEDHEPLRQTAYEQLNHLINITSRFREIMTKAIDSYYSRDKCFETEDIFRLAALIMEMNENF